MAVVTILSGAASGIIASAVESVIDLIVDLTEWDDVRWFPPPSVFLSLQLFLKATTNLLTLNILLIRSVRHSPATR